MLTVFTPPPTIIKKEPREIKIEPMGPDTPWAMQAVTVRTGPDQTPQLLRVEPVHKGNQRAPWVKQEEPAARTREEQPPAVHHRPVEQPHAPPRWDQRPGQHALEVSRSSRPLVSRPPPVKHVSARNYAAVEAGLERYGLIDEGQQSGGRALLIHVRKRCRPPFLLLNAVRPGTVLQVKRSSKTAKLRVRSTTPARYYSPGSLVTTLEILVDEADWRSLAAVAPGI
jgi:hypothetical protein